MSELTEQLTKKENAVNKLDKEMSLLKKLLQTHEQTKKPNRLSQSIGTESMDNDTTKDTDHFLKPYQELIEERRQVLSVLPCFCFGRVCVWFAKDTAKIPRTKTLTHKQNQHSHLFYAESWMKCLKIKNKHKLKLKNYETN